MSQIQPRRARPRYALGIFWLALTVAAVMFGIDTGDIAAYLLAPVLAAYSVYLFRGGRYGFFIL
jgi:hypothetical protein